MNHILCWLAGAVSSPLWVEGNCMVTARGGCAGSLQLVHTPGSGLVSQIFTSNLDHVLCLSLESSYSGKPGPNTWE